MNVQRDHGWMRRGFSLLWDAGALSKVVSPSDVVSIRKLFAMVDAWPQDLPGAGGDALVVAGVEGCLDALNDEDGKLWLETDLSRAVLSFQREFEGQAALILWIPSGKRRISMAPATEEYSWTGPSGPGSGLPIGQCLWAGTQSDVSRILFSDDPEAGVDSSAYVGLYHPRIS